MAHLSFDAVVREQYERGADDLQADFERLTAQGVTFDSPPQVRPWATEAVMRDQDGNMIVLQQD